MLILAVLLILAFGLATPLSGCTPPPDPGPRPVVGLMDAVEIDVATKVPGRIRDLFVKEGDSVKEGDQLVTIESEEILAKVDQVNAAIMAAGARLRMAQRGAREEDKEAVKRQLEAARHQAELAKKMYDRVLALRQMEAVPSSKFDEVEAQYMLANDQLAVVQSRYDMVMNGARVEEIQALQALVKQGEGSLAEVNAYMKETAQPSPIAGEVTKIVLHKGELAATGYPILTLVDLNDQWASFSVREDMLQKIQMDQEIQVEIPALGKTVRMKVFNISALGDFATWRATSEKNSFDLKSFEVKARPVEAVPGLRPGMTVRWYPN